MEVCRGIVKDKDVVIRFEHVHKTYHRYRHLGGMKNLILNFPKSLGSWKNTGFRALNDVSFEIKRGEAIGLIGKNGAGKSTVLGLVAGVLRPTKGTIGVNGRISPLLELGAGFHQDLTGLENIVLNGVLLGLNRAEVLRKMDEIIAFSGIEEFIDQPIRVYSSGMVTRLGFSVAAHLDPDILLVDEMLAVGDSDFQKKCLDKMAYFKNNGVTIVFVSHSAKDVRRICSRAIWFEDHTVKRTGDVNEILEAYGAIDR